MSQEALRRLNDPAAHLRNSQYNVNGQLIPAGAIRDPYSAAGWRALTPADFGHTGGAPAGGSAQGAYQAEVRDLLSGQAGRIMGDPYYQTALDFYSGAASGTNVPFNEAMTNRLYGRQADMNAAAQSAQQQMLTDQYASRGGSIYDPSFGAEQLAQMAARQTNNAGARRAIDIEAAAGNYDAQMAGAQGLTGVRGQQYGMANQLNSQLAGYLAGAQHTQDVRGGIPQSRPGTVPVSTPQLPRGPAPMVSPSQARNAQASGTQQASRPPTTAAPRPPTYGGWSTPQSDLTPAATGNNVSVPYRVSGGQAPNPTNQSGVGLYPTMGIY